MAWLYCH